MAIELLVTTRRGGFVQSPPGYLSLPPDAVENPEGSGLYDIMAYLVESGDGLYLIPEFEAVDYFSGNRSNLHGYSVQEDASPLDPGDMGGGIGQVTINFNEGVDTLYLNKETVTLRDSDPQWGRGEIETVIRNLSVENTQVTAVADSAMTLFNSEHTVLPMRGRLGDVLLSYAALVGSSNPFIVDPAIADRQVVYPGWRGNVWDRLKQIMSREQIEITLIGGVITARPIRTISAIVDKDLSRGIAVNDQNTAKVVEVAYFNNTWGTRQEVYPVPSENEPSIYTVDANETLEVEVSLNASLTSVNQPTCVEFVENRSYAGTNGVYAVAGSDGLPVMPNQWTQNGGSVRVYRTDDPSTIRIVIKGASSTLLAPYRIAMTSGSGNYYNSLHITGTGVTWDRQAVRVRTGATSATTGEEVGTVVENPFVSTKSEAYSLAAHTVARYAGEHSITGVTTSIQPASPEDQAFGNIAGARVQRGPAQYRITRATITPDSVNYSGVMDTLTADFDEVWSGKTVADFNAQWSDRLVKDFNTQPLRRDDA